MVDYGIPLARSSAEEMGDRHAYYRDLLTSGEGTFSSAWRHHLAVILPEAGAALDIGDQERSRDRGLIDHDRLFPAPVRELPDIDASSCVKSFGARGTGAIVSSSRQVS